MSVCIMGVSNGCVYNGRVEWACPQSKGGGVKLREFWALVLEVEKSKYTFLYIRKVYIKWDIDNSHTRGVRCTYPYALTHQYTLSHAH